MAFHVGDQKEVALLLSFLECRTFILEGREKYQYIGDQILPARSALELLRPTFAVEFDATETAAAEFMAALDAFDTFARDHAEAFNAFFAYEHGRFAERNDMLENWVWDDGGNSPEIPAAHWWWAPISSGEA